METASGDASTSGTILGSFGILYVVCTGGLAFVLIAVLGFGNFSSSIPVLVAAVALLGLLATYVARRGMTVTATPDALVFSGRLCRTPDIPWTSVAEISSGQLGASLVLRSPVAHFPTSKHVIFTCLDPAWRKRPLVKAVSSRVAHAQRTSTST